MSDGGMLDRSEPRGTGKHFVPPKSHAGHGRPGTQNRLDELAASLRLGQAEPGVVYLVGAGPGDPGLVTVRAARLVATADVVLHDLLVAQELLDLARPEAELYDVGKVGDGRHVAQEDTNALMVRLAQEGRSVVRLKGGDPFVFGRGGEELAELLEAGVRAEVVAGVTSGTGALAAAGIPATHRLLASAVAFVTGHGHDEKPESGRDWGSLAHFPGTLVFYMAVKALPIVSRELIAHGRSPDEPAAVIERGTSDEQRVTRATLAELPKVARAARVRAPALVVVGDVAGLGGELDWRAMRPLDGKRVVVTRAGDHAAQLAGRLRSLGAIAIELPAIRTEPTGEPLPSLEGAQLVCVSSPAAADALRAALSAEGKDLRALAGAKVAAVGPGTADALRRHGITADLVPTRAVTEGLIEAIDAAGLKPSRAVIVQAKGGRTLLADTLRGRGVDVAVAALHETLPEPLGERDLSDLRGADAVLFASGSAVHAVKDALGADGAEVLRTLRCIAIGPTTATALTALGVEPAAVADPHTPDGLVEATVGLLG
ncbi:MAG: uroporphyrinogen-III C-methyltransferase [Solirubrobacteraceae bacterium]|nr:uroporphyrinogen-III C-methyltransferase [Solirubrobacteraceae bacterium]